MEEIRRYITGLDAERVRLEDGLGEEGLTEIDKTRLINIRDGIDYAMAKLHESFPSELEDFVPQRLSPDTLIESIGFNSRVRRILSRFVESQGARTLKNLSQYTESAFRCQRGCGVLTTRQIRQLLNSASLDFKKEDY